MNNKDYMKMADVTGVHDNFDFGEARRIELLNTLRRFVVTTEVLDTIKKDIFYSEAKPDDLFTDVNKDILHGILGAATETQEMVEVLILALEGTPIDEENLLEETGDVLWYLNRILRGIDKTFTQAMGGNIRKLKARFGDKFTAAKAHETRNKKAEMEAMNGEG